MPPQRRLFARSFEGWYNVCWRVSCYFPGITLLVLTVLNLLIHHTGSSGAIPLGAFFSLVSLWFVVSIPLCYSGAPLPNDCLEVPSCQCLPPLSPEALTSMLLREGIVAQAQTPAYEAICARSSSLIAAS